MKEQYILLRAKFSHTKEQFINKSKLIHGDKYDYSLVDYVNAKTPVDIICPIHGTFSQVPDKHTHGHGCPKCARNYKPTLEEFIEKSKGVFGELYDYSNVKYVNKSTPISVICKKCGNVFNVTPHNHLIHKEGCPFCRQSKMENSIKQLLEEHNIMFKQQKVFDWLINGKSIKKLDFYLPDYNVAIECQGLQHFKPIDFFGGNEYLIRQQKNDNIKRKLCEEHNIEVLYYSDSNIEFPYDVITEREKIIEKLKSIK